VWVKRRKEERNELKARIRQAVQRETGDLQQSSHVHSCLLNVFHRTVPKYIHTHREKETESRWHKTRRAKNNNNQQHQQNTGTVMHIADTRLMTAMLVLFLL
jgi:hypothetical protein